MNVTILGNGGAVSDGLAYNGFIIGDHILCEAPPDIMISLHREGIDIRKLDEIFISHFHADHYFGFPFLMLALFMLDPAAERKLLVSGPAGVQSRIFSLTETAFSKEHPCISWMERNLVFKEITAGSTGQMGIYQASFYRMEHFSETYGFVLTKGSFVPFAYIADTLWCDHVEAMLSLRPEKVLLDLNGEPDDRRQIHLSEKDILEKGIPITGKQTVYYGTHLKKEKESTAADIFYVKPGDRIVI